MVAAVEEGNAERRQLSRLRRSRSVATGMLAFAGAVFIGTLAVPQPGTGVLLLRAVAEAALVGGLADWFAVTALFRRPLRLPIPHTAILPANKDRIGEGLARFLDRHFLTPELLVPELRSLNIAERVAAGLANRRNAALLADEIARALPLVLRAVDDRQIRAFLGRALGAQLRQAEFEPLLGRLLRVLTSAGYHEAVLDAALDYGRDFLARNEDKLIEGVGERRRRWIPPAINREIARAMLRSAAQLLDDLRQPDGAARQALLTQIDRFADALTSAAGHGSGDGGPRRGILNRPEMREWIGASWNTIADRLLADLEGPSSAIRRALSLIVASLGDTLKSDPAMRARLDAMIEAMVVEALPWRAELIRFVTEVVHRWEPRGFSDRIETAVGADLQYIRMNGTVVGGLVGGVLFLLSVLAR